MAVYGLVDRRARVRELETKCPIQSVNDQGKEGRVGGKGWREGSRAPAIAAIISVHGGDPAGQRFPASKF